MPPFVLLFALAFFGAVVFGVAETTVKVLGDSLGSPFLRKDGLVFWKAEDALYSEEGMIAPNLPNQLGDNPFGDIQDANATGFVNYGSFDTFEEPSGIGSGYTSRRALYLNATTRLVYFGDDFPGLQAGAGFVQPSGALFDADGSVVFGIYYLVGSVRHHAICRRHGPGGAISLLLRTGKEAVPGGRGATFENLELNEIANGNIYFRGEGGDRRGVYVFRPGGPVKVVLDNTSSLPGVETPPGGYNVGGVVVDGDDIATSVVHGIFKRIGGVWSQVAAIGDPIPENTGTFAGLGGLALRGGRVTFIGTAAVGRNEPFHGGIYTEDVEGFKTLIDDKYNFGYTVTRIRASTWSNGSKVAVTFSGGTTNKVTAITYTPPPIAARADRRLITSNVRVSIPVLSNDLSGPSFGKLHLTSVSTAEKGTVKRTGDTVTYQPAPNFDGEDTFTYTMTDGTDTATGTVTIVNPYLEWAGSFTQLVLDPDQRIVGFIKATVGRTGIVTGSLNLNSATHPLRGAVNGDGEFRQTIGTGATALVATFTLGENLQGQALLTGRLETGGVVFPLGGGVARAKSLPPGIESGRYPVLLPRATSTGDAPLGTGWATMQLSRGGSITMAGQLADRTSFTCGLTLAVDGSVTLFVPVYKQQPGELAGQLNFRALPASDVDGTLRLRKPARTPAATLFPSFELTIAASGALYRVPTPLQHNLAYTASPARAQIATIDGNVPPISSNLTVSLSGRCTIDEPNTFRVSINFPRSAGTFSGSFFPTGSTRAVNFGGVFHQKLNLGRGLFHGEGQSGTITFSPQ